MRYAGHLCKSLRGEINSPLLRYATMRMRNSWSSRATSLINNYCKSKDNINNMAKPTCTKQVFSQVQDKNDWWTDKSNIQAIRDYAMLQGLIVRASGEPNDCSVVNVSVTLTPSKFPEELFELAHNIQGDINKLVDAVSRDKQFLSTVLERVMKTDHFTRKLFEIHSEVSKNNKKTSCVLGIHRSDYLLDYNPSMDPPLSLKQVEINTISVGGFALSQDSLPEFQRYVSSRYSNSTFKLLNIPPNPCLSSVTDGVACAWKQYGKESSCVLFVVQSGEQNIYGQRPLEFDLWKRYGIMCIRKTLTELSSEAVHGPEGELFVSSFEVCVVYYRAGYCPNDYPSEKEWLARLLLESSQAVCCPSVAYQLVGTKKVQQALAEDGVLERFISEGETIKKIRSTFTGLYSLDNNEIGDRNVEMALKDPKKFVMKPQREGGGNNVFGEEVGSLLRRLGSSPEREAYILMDRIHPPAQVGIILRSNPEDELQLTPLIGELGIFGVYVRNGEEILLNTDTGHILRSKPAATDEGGVSVCARIKCGALDSPSLLPLENFISSISSLSS